MEIDTTTYKTDGRKTTNDALITLLRAGVIASIMMLVLGAGATRVVDGNGGADFTSIPAAVGAAIDGDSIADWGGNHVCGCGLG